MNKNLEVSTKKNPEPLVNYSFKKNDALSQNKLQKHLSLLFYWITNRTTIIGWTGTRLRRKYLETEHQHHWPVGRHHKTCTPQILIRWENSGHLKFWTDDGAKNWIFTIFQNLKFLTRKRPTKNKNMKVALLKSNNSETSV